MWQQQGSKRVRITCVLLYRDFQRGKKVKLVAANGAGKIRDQYVRYLIKY